MPIICNVPKNILNFHLLLKKLCYYTMDLQFHKFFYPDTIPIPELSMLHFQKLWYYDKKLKTVVDWFYHRKLLLTSFSMRFQTFYHYVLSICWFYTTIILLCLRYASCIRTYLHVDFIYMSFLYVCLCGGDWGRRCAEMSHHRGMFWF